MSTTIAPSAVQSERNGKGQFTPGNTLGHRFRPGESGNPAGQRSAEALVSQWINALLGRTRAELEDALKVADAPMAKRLAVRRILAADDVAEHADPGRDFDRVVDRVEGRARQAIEVTTAEEKPVDIAALLAEARRAAGASRPDPRDAEIERLKAALAEAGIQPTQIE